MTEDDVTCDGWVVMRGIVPILLREIERLREYSRDRDAAVFAHHDIANLSEGALREGIGAPCPICRRAKEERLARGARQRST